MRLGPTSVVYPLDEVERFLRELESHAASNPGWEKAGQGMPRQSVVPGFRFDAKSRRTFLEVTLPDTRGRVRRRKTVEATTRDEALSLFQQFRTEVLAERVAVWRLLVRSGPEGGATNKKLRRYI